MIPIHNPAGGTGSCCKPSEGCFHGSLLHKEEKNPEQSFMTSLFRSSQAWVCTAGLNSVFQDYLKGHHLLSLLITTCPSRESMPSLGCPIGILVRTHGCLLGKGGHKNPLLVKMALAIPTYCSSGSFVRALLRTCFPIFFLFSNSPRAYGDSLD